eukprot:Amastigsp_a179869_5.p3 type:complete len:227 gc:universal Amastigsp_a179869_5:434-1114(+)
MATRPRRWAPCPLIAKHSLRRGGSSCRGRSRCGSFPTLITAPISVRFRCSVASMASTTSLSRIGSRTACSALSWSPCSVCPQTPRGFATSSRTGAAGHAPRFATGSTPRRSSSLVANPMLLSSMPACTICSLRTCRFRSGRSGGEKPSTELGGARQATHGGSESSLRSPSGSSGDDRTSASSGDKRLRRAIVPRARRSIARGASLWLRSLPWTGQPKPSRCWTRGR